MTRHVEPRAASLGAGTVGTVAMVTASYARDFDRCRLLCETMDEHMRGVAHHYLLVAHQDVALFRQLQGPRRTVIDERDLLPRWLVPLPDPSSLFRRNLWIGPWTEPMRGWHVQQLRRIAVAGVIGEDALLFADSDVAFVRDFDAVSIWDNGRLPLFRRENGLIEKPDPRQLAWSANAGAALGIEPVGPSPHDYISTLIAWRRQSVVAMCRRIEAMHGRSWVEVLGSNRNFSECMLYGRYVDEVEVRPSISHTDRELCRIYWEGPGLDHDGLVDFVGGLEPHQVAVGIQSFTGTDIGRIRIAIERAGLTSPSPAAVAPYRSAAPKRGKARKTAR